MHALAVGEDGWLYVGGYFETAGAISASNVARWNGSTWQALGAGLSDRVHALTFHDGELIAAGDFIASGATAVSRIARWNGTSWQPLGDGLGGDGWPSVRALTVYEGDLIAGGMFETAGGEPASFVARWDGTFWHPLGEGLGYWVHALGAFDGSLFAGGEFQTAGGQPANYVAAWDGAQWNPLENGVNLWALALHEHAGDLYAGGWFTAAGVKPSFFLARWLGEGTADVPAPALRSSLALSLIGPRPSTGRAELAFTLPAAGIARLTIHDVAGRLVAAPLEEMLPQGAQRAVWNGRDEAGRAVAPGIYFARLEAGGESVVARILLARR